MDNTSKGPKQLFYFVILSTTVHDIEEVKLLEFNNKKYARVEHMSRFYICYALFFAVLTKKRRGQD